MITPYNIRKVAEKGTTDYYYKYSKNFELFLCNIYHRVRVCNLISNHQLPWLCSLTYFYYVNRKKNNY